MTPPTILITGATGNTALPLVQTLSHIHTSQTNPFLATHRILALTRTLTSPTSKYLTTLPGITLLQHSYLDITPSFLRTHNVVRAFIASQTTPSQFAEESTFLIACLEAGVEYVVRMSTTDANVKADCRAFYPRSHWAVEKMLESEEFKLKGMGWTSLRANVFAGFWLGGAVDFVKGWREKGEKGGVLRLIADEEAGVGVVDPKEVGVLAARLLAMGEEEVKLHKGRKYVINGPGDVSGRDIVRMVEEEIGEEVREVVFRDTSMVEAFVEGYPRELRNVISSFVYSGQTAWDGECTADTTSKEVLEIAPPKRTAEEVFRELVRG
ncbi:hypothetical protein QBC34DRAFT_360981 [Podospora aff. communis PSN243]|uniref:NmrA-like domain-containing protein n=1 Tax=Podospora aff. communis PSN243 TaxID=3040156 RepID=A0AAV9G9T8_9PEZI|nr:hypothetical protein QBC34DRAFT_360981 [Podospora aff. communis PSN243]